ncbi:MAG: tetratricopeptide repeat protein [Cyanobacteriota bacterium]
MNSDKKQHKENIVLSGNRGLSEDSSPLMESEGFFRQGLDKFNRSDYRSAIEAFNQALQVNPDLAEAYRHRAKSHYYQGDYLEAIKDYSHVLRINPRNAGAYSDRGLIRAQMGDRPRAMQDYNQALQLDANCVPAYLNRGFLRVELEDYKGAIADCNAALNITPDLPEAYLNRGLARYELEDFQGAKEDYDQALQINPYFAAAYYNRGVTLVAAGEYQDAIANFDQALQLHPNDAQVYLNRGYTRLQLGDNWGCMEDFDQALKIDPVSAKAFLSQIAYALNDEQDTFEDENQQLVQGLILQGDFRYQSGDYQAALKAFDHALTLDSNNPEAYNRRSTVRSVLGDYQGAMEDLEKAKHLSLSQDTELQHIVIDRGDAQTGGQGGQGGQERRGKREKIFSMNATASEPSVPPTPVATVELSAQDYYQRGVAKLNQGDFLEAIQDFNQVLQMKGQDATALTCRGFAYARLGENQRAIADLKMAAKLFYEQGDVKSSKEIVETLKKLQQ